eukprot:TRINITY_DN866_c0_g1_i1.p1 TRINITY_DN866_c0_g1~~TRINITY_DN866_c0_g1_i1.p1  ORF type:complete len:166 (+),score=15.76 TRINITY_DN866_c0_g1_i1:64-561(+)
MSECRVCGDAKWKYKTPCCKTRYCTAECYKNHFEVCGCSGERKETEEERQKRTLAIKEDVLREREVTDALTVASYQLESITKDPSVRNQLKDPRLQSLIKAIDGNLDRESALDAAVEATPEFAAFYNHIAHLLLATDRPAKRRRADPPQASGIDVVSGTAPTDHI